MEIEVWLFVLALLAAFLVGSLLVAFAAHRRLRSSVAEGRDTLDKLKRAEAELHEAEVDARRQANQSQELTTSAEADRAALAQAGAELTAVQAELELRDTGATATERQLADFRRRFNDIVGLESEIATLRVIAARVPELEHRLSELAADVESDPADDPTEAADNDNTVIDLRNCDHQQAK